MNELVIISGKGGTGKSSIAASFASMAKNKVIADCDVDAPDLHLLLRPEVEKEEDFHGGWIARIDAQKCTQCGECTQLCRFQAISGSYEIDESRCEGCGVCAEFCPCMAIEMERKITARKYISKTPYGPFVHGRLAFAEGNSGKLVSAIKEDARRIAKENGYPLIIIDGSPGIGCPVIASLAGSKAALCVTEPTVAGLHDLKRIFELTRHFRINTLACVNKYDVSEEITAVIEQFCKGHDITMVGTIPYDPDTVKAQINAMSVVEYSRGRASREIRNIWDRVSELM